ncbi:hypothetical protein HPB48_014415 [Haemaphysalis longicornis]|uniref:Uncharacterized protein n=1 Tax=Haemaphysalis longicornis TaxID=44386 RepID=A0A9J6FC20_HAELO|nr:hypothetical protein HPB48_014415 [Haemaphysalis longicornis]
MDAIKPPGPLQLSGKIRRNWELFKQRLDLFLTVTSPEKPRREAVKAAILLSTAGKEPLEIFNNFTSLEVSERTTTPRWCANSMSTVSSKGTRFTSDICSACGPKMRRSLSDDFQEC